MERIPCVYILASQRNGALYTGVTSNLPQRVVQHQLNMVVGFTRQYHVHLLVWYEVHLELESAMIREELIKRWCREGKQRLIEGENPEWADLYPQIVACAGTSGALADVAFL